MSFNKTGCIIDDIWSHNFHNAVKSRVFQKNVIYLQHQDRHNMQVVVVVVVVHMHGACYWQQNHFIVTTIFLHPLWICLLCQMTTHCTMHAILMIKIGETFSYQSQSILHQTTTCIMVIKLVIILWHIEILGRKLGVIGKQVALHGKIKGDGKFKMMS